MRKIVLIKEMDPLSFIIKLTLKEKLDDGSVITIFSEPLEISKSKYSKEQLEKIDQCNKILLSKGLPELSEEEADYMLDPSGIDKRLDSLEQEMKNPETLQRLAGFKVEKKIIPLD